MADGTLGPYCRECQEIEDQGRPRRRAGHQRRGRNSEAATARQAG